MFFVYIIQSKKDKNLYIGYTNDLRERFKKHNLGLVKSTKPRAPFQLVYYEAYSSKQDAVKREHNLKLQAKALAQLKNRIRSCFEE
ncbi:MAG: GIY-YIG nuclease family protein [Candidatus Staskawiczbacteria bacterium]|nr:GIY-YIG nuclease family protein [Candidatus Staskawiczbacteria bacterium]